MKSYHFLIISGIIFYIIGCANPGTPSGGPKDETPPVVVKSVPVDKALNFKGKKIVVTFDELIQVKDVNQKLVVSPPMNKMPIVDVHGSDMLVEIEDTLQDNTTYTFDFADAVVDNNEGNVYPNFTISFSTGEKVDSMEISGHLWEAGTYKPIEGALICLHRNLSDTAFKTLVPVRLAKSNKDGGFRLQNVSPGKYHIYALKDVNRNYKFDQHGESIAWSDSIIVPSFEYKQFRDSVGKDSVHIYEKMVYTPDSLELFMFEQVYYDQYLVNDDRPEKGRVRLTFNEPLDSFSIKLASGENVDDWGIYEWSYKKDSVDIWIKDSLIYNRDSLTLAFQYLDIDSAENHFIKKDTLTFYYFEPEEKESKRKKKKEAKEGKKEIPSLSILKIPTQLNLFSPLTYMLKTTPVKYDPSGIQLFELVDTVLEKVDFSLIQDSLNNRLFSVNRRWNPGATYELKIDSATYIDIYGLLNKEIRQRFIITKESDYSTLYLNIENPEKNMFVQILGSGEKPVRQLRIHESGKIRIGYLKPGEYMLRLVDDRNGNDIWDSGDFEKRYQPEAVYYYPEKIKLRADWDHEIKWNKESFDIFKFVETFRSQKNTSNSDRR
ncbi:MAG: Ig-like domain-containing protein [Marinilabiliaceae bacterium]|nr:Ig-like domain-containing protein [Marinilabiliaceae bacterium]